MIDQGAETVAFASCIRLGKPLGMGSNWPWPKKGYPNIRN
jgi:hypothetical protein